MRYLLESLEPRQLLAFSGNFTDVDGDQYQIAILGPGDAQVTTSQGNSTGFIQDLQVVNTTAASILRISLLAAAGDGRVDVFNLHSTLVKTFDARIADVPDNGNVWFDDAGSVNFGDVNDANFRVNKDAQAPFTARKATLRHLGSSSSVLLRAFQKSLSVQSGDETVLFLGEGAGSVTCAGDFIGGFITDQFGPAGPIGSIKIGGVGRLNGTSGPVGSISAQSFLIPPGPNAFQVFGTLGKLTSTAGNAGRWLADNFGTVSGATFSGELKSAVPDASGFTFKSIKFSGAATGGFIGTFDPLPATGVEGVIGTLSVGSWSLGTIQAAGINQFKVAGALQNASLTLSGVSQALTLGSMKVGGEVSGGIFVVLGNAGPITMASAENGNAPSFTDGPASGAFRSITLTSKTVVVSSLNVTVASLGSLTCAHGLIASNLEFDTPSGFAIKSFKAAGQLQSVDVNTNGNAGIDTFSARGFFNSTWNLGFINSVKLGAVFKGADGGMSGVTLSLSGANPLGFAIKSFVSGDDVHAVINATAPHARIGSMTVSYFSDSTLLAATFGALVATSNTSDSVAYIHATDALLTGISIDSLDFRGGLRDSQINAAGSIDRFSTLKFSDQAPSIVTAGSDAIKGLPDTLSGFAIASINQIKVTGAFGPDPVFAFATFAADTIGRVTINGRTSTAGPIDFGFAARHYGPFSLRLNSGATANLTIPTALGDFNALQPDSNGHFVVRVLP